MFIFESELPPLIKNTKTVLQHLRDNDLYLKPSKCEFHKTKIEYLGLVIEEGKISMDTTKLNVMGVTSLHSRSVLGRDSNKELSSVRAKDTSKGSWAKVVDWTV